MGLNNVGFSSVLPGDKNIPPHLTKKFPKEFPTPESDDTPCIKQPKFGCPEDHCKITKLPGARLGEIFKELFSHNDHIIDEALQAASAKYPGSQTDALQGFHKDIKCMTQTQLDDMKDSLVSRMSSQESSQWDRNLLQKMYDITDAVAEHRQPPHLDEFPIWRMPVPMPMPFPGKPDFPKHWIDKGIMPLNHG